MRRDTAARARPIASVPQCQHAQSLSLPHRSLARGAHLLYTVSPLYPPRGFVGPPQSHPLVFARSSAAPASGVTGARRSATSIQPTAHNQNAAFAETTADKAEK